MQTGDGSKLVPDAAGRLRTILCTRWQELCETVSAVEELATILGARTDFLLLNPTAEVPQHVTIAHDKTRQDISSAVPPGHQLEHGALRQRLKSAAPAGTTPLTEAVQRVIRIVEPLAGQLRANGQQAVLTLATDGQPNDPRSFLEALRYIQQLPVWVVVRLCTNEDHVVKYWSDLDAQLELPLEVLDDDRGEAEEIVVHNPWLTYGPPLHVARAFGLRNKLFDLLDEKPLLPTQVKQFCELLLGCASLPEPELGYAPFCAALDEALTDVAMVYDPLRSTTAPWIKSRRLQGPLAALFCGAYDKGCVLS